MLIWNNSRKMFRVTLDNSSVTTASSEEIGIVTDLGEFSLRNGARRDAGQEEAGND